MANTLVLPVPERLLSLYVVAAPERMPSGLAERPVGHAAKALSADGAPLVDVAPRVEVIEAGRPPLAGMVELLGCLDCGPHLDPATLAKVRSAERHLMVAATYGPAWPPLHAWTAVTTAEALAVATGGILFDPEAPLLRPVRWAPCALRDRHRFAVGEWLEVGVSADQTDIRRGMWMTTAGLARFGLPELQGRRIPPDLTVGWCDVVNGLAQTLLRAHWADLDVEPGRAFREIAETVTVTSEDVEAATGRRYPPGSAEVRLRLDPGAPGRASYLTVLPPRAFRGPAGRWRREIVAALLGG
ncbi:hypothetical protein [Actinomadura sp. HBU206391]|uniref:hypothetical protein n=1 Tax=Actinomadura sp. HBU206391 TaxID=2731692 RepID=UPI00164FFB9F|nr:hypothetical protein [Actinomadura sp. HBU206391]MBC6457800.1 hypothetical protein [Actinomadura sp. HBU206391]